jgi:hypothetical protein
MAVAKRPVVERERYVTLAEAAELTGKTAKALAARIQRGKLPAEKRGGRVLVPIAALYDAGLIRLPPAATVDAMLDRIEALSRRVGELEQQLRQRD